MSLAELWLKSRDQIETKLVQQIIGFAGEGKLRDGNETSTDFRKLLSYVPSDLLADYADQCLSSKFDNSGYVLQDIVNQVGERLGFAVKYGRYQGTKNDIGFDGLWSYPNKHALVVEIKTTDAYRIKLGKINEYRTKLSSSEAIQKELSSILIIVGREDTGDLEAQIRGSKFAWDIRLISVDSLFELLRIKEEVEDPETVSRIHQILIPREFTKLDEIINIVFSTTEDIRQDEISLDENEIKRHRGSASKNNKPVSFNEACAKRIADQLNITLIKETAASFRSPDKSQGLVCSVSKEHMKAGIKYWYAFHPYQKKYLDQFSRALIAFGCGSEETVLLIPFGDFEKWVGGMNVTETEKKMYWHVHITKEREKFFLIRKKGTKKVELTKYLLST